MEKFFSPHGFKSFFRKNVLIVLLVRLSSLLTVFIQINMLIFLYRMFCFFLIFFFYLFSISPRFLLSFVSYFPHLFLFPFMLTELLLFFSYIFVSTPPLILTSPFNFLSPHPLLPSPLLTICLVRSFFLPSSPPPRYIFLPCL